MSTADHEQAPAAADGARWEHFAEQLAMHRSDPTQVEHGLALAAQLVEAGRAEAALETLEATLATASETELQAAPRRRATVVAVGRAVLRSAPMAARRLAERELGYPERRPDLLDLHAAALAATGEGRRALAILRARLAAEPAADARARLATEAAALLRAQDRTLDAADLLETVALELDDILETAPERFEAFELQTRLLVSARRWVSLHAAYRRMVARIDPEEPALQPHLAQMWQTMADLSLTRLGREQRAAEEASVAAVHRARIPGPTS